MAAERDRKRPILGAALGGYVTLAFVIWAWQFGDLLRAVIKRFG